MRVKGISLDKELQRWASRSWLSILS